MKAKIISLLFLFLFTQVKAQDYLISFAGTGASTTVDSVKIQNLIQGTEMTINGLDTLNLVLIIGIIESGSAKRNALNVWPNPFSDKGTIEFDAPVKGPILITISDISGKVVSGSEQFALAGWNVFSITGLGPGVYSVVVLSEKFRYAGKLISIRSAPGMVLVSPGTGNQHLQKLKTCGDTRSFVQMQYNDGEQLLLTGYSGTFATVVPLVPTQSMTQTFNFIECTDTDGHHYPVVEIGFQVWMAKNLNVGTRIYGTQNQTNNGIKEKYCYNNLESFCDIYGGMYQWQEMMQYVTTQGVQGICPAGWHLPTDAEWTTLTTYVNSQPSYRCNNQTGWIAKALAATTLWQIDYESCTVGKEPFLNNKTGFTTLPGGSRGPEGGYGSIWRLGGWWASTQLDGYTAWGRGLGNNGAEVARDNSYKNAGINVRCLRD